MPRRSREGQNIPGLRPEPPGTPGARKGDPPSFTGTPRKAGAVKRVGGPKRPRTITKIPRKMGKG
jgi:hypothetical protein